MPKSIVRPTTVAEPPTLHQIRAALVEIEDAQNALSRAAAHLSSIRPGARVPWKKLCTLSDKCKALWFATEERVLPQAERFQLDHEPGDDEIAQYCSEVRR